MSNFKVKSYTFYLANLYLILICIGLDYIPIEIQALFCHLSEIKIFSYIHQLSIKINYLKNEFYKICNFNIIKNRD